MLKPELEVERRLAAWMLDQRLESRVGDALAVAALAGALGGEPDWSVLESTIGAPSLLSYFLLGEAGLTPSLELAEWHSGDAPNDYKLTKFFQRRRHYGNPGFYDRAAFEMENNGVGFFLQWGWEVDELCRRTGIPPLKHSSQLAPNSATMEGVISDTPQLEAIRSGYLRALAWAADRMGVPLELCISWSMESLAADVGLLSVAPSRPVWWPRRECLVGGETDVDLSRVYSDIEDALACALGGGKLVAQIEGPLCRSDRLVIDAEVRAFFVRFHGDESPCAATVFEGMGTEGILPSEIRSSVEGALSPATKCVSLDADWECFPAVVPLLPVPVARWQPERNYRMPWAPASYLFQGGLEASRSLERMRFLVGSQAVGEWCWWHELASVSHRFNLPPCSGQSVEIPSEIAMKFADEEGFRIAWVARISTSSREYGYGEWSTATEYCLMNAQSGMTRASAVAFARLHFLAHGCTDPHESVVERVADLAMLHGPKDLSAASRLVASLS